MARPGLLVLSGFESSRVGEHPVNSHRIGDVLDFAISERLVSANQLVLDLLANATRYKPGQELQCFQGEQLLSHPVVGAILWSAWATSEQLEGILGRTTMIAQVAHRHGYGARGAVHGSKRGLRMKRDGGLLLALLRHDEVSRIVCRR
jgi:hypothetical protein